MSLVAVAPMILESAVLELATLGLLGWCLIHSTTKFLLREQFWNFLMSCEVEEP
jgi:hypothetical protein